MKRDGEIKKIFENYHPEPPAHLWGEIDSRLSSGKKSEWKQYALYAATIALLITFTWGGYRMFMYNQILEQTETDTAVVLIQEDEMQPLMPISLADKTEPELYKKETQIKKETPVHISERITETITDKEIKEELMAVEDPQERAVAEDITTEGLLADATPITPIRYTEISEINRDVLLKKEPEKTFIYSDLYVSQTEQKEDMTGFNRWSFGVKAAPQYAYRLNSSDPDVLDGGKSIFEKNEKHLITYNLGLTATYQINDKLSLESGLSYLKMGQSVRNIQVYFDPYKKSPSSLLTSMGEVSFYDPTLYFDDRSSERIIDDENDSNPMGLDFRGNRINQNIDFLEIPVVLLYSLYKRQTQIQLKGGVGFNYLVSNKVVLDNEGRKENIGETALVRDWNMSVMAGIALKIPITNRINFHLEPVANLFVNSMTHGSEYNVYPFGISLYTGLSMPL